MKSLLLIALVFSVAHVLPGQDFPINPETKKIDYTEVMQVAGADKNTLYTRAKAWAAPPLTKMEDDKEGGRYTAKGQIKSKYPAPMKGYFNEGFINYVVTISAKDGKYKYEITDITHTSTRGNGGNLENAIPECGKYTLTLEGWSTIKNQAKTELPKIVQDLKTAMDAKVPADQVKKAKDDW